MAYDRIELYIGLLDVVDTPEGFAACRGVLSPDEIDRSERFTFDQHRKQYIFAHGLLRSALSNAAPHVARSDWRFETNRYGRPFVVDLPGIYFNLSHTEGCVTCIVSGREAVGVDVECIRLGDALLELARRVFSPEEVETLGGLSACDSADRFFDLWTLKEAYLKATGVGLNVPLDRFSILISRERIGIAFKSDFVDGPRRWHFTTRSPSPVHRLAIADGSGVEGGLPIVLHPWPLPGAIK
jgi:4'-phosphopantetheinyl transferase